MPTTQETDGFQVKRPGDVNVKCTLLLMLDHQVPPMCSSSRRVTCLHLSDETFMAPLLLRIFLPSLLSTNWTRGWPACWACTRRHGPASCKLFGSTSRTTSCRTVMRRSTSTATVTSDRYSKSLEAAFKHQIHTVFFFLLLPQSGLGLWVCTTDFHVFHWVLNVRVERQSEHLKHFLLL